LILAGPCGHHRPPGSCWSRGFLYRQRDGRLPVHPDQGGLFFKGILYLSNIPDINGLFAHVGDDDILDGFHHAELGLGKEAVIVGAGLDISRGEDQVGLLDGLNDGVRRKVEGLQALPVEMDLDLPLLTPPTRAEATLGTCSISGSIVLKARS